MRLPIHPQEELAKFSKEDEFGARICLLVVCLTEREKTWDLVFGFSFGRTLTDRKIERREERNGEHSAKLLVILEWINHEHQ